MFDTVVAVSILARTQCYRDFCASLEIQCSAVKFCNVSQCTLAVLCCQFQRCDCCCQFRTCCGVCCRLQIIIICFFYCCSRFFCICVPGIFGVFPFSILANILVSNCCKLFGSQIVLKCHLRMFLTLEGVVDRHCTTIIGNSNGCSRKNVCSARSQSCRRILSEVIAFFRCQFYADCIVLIWLTFLSPASMW